MPSKKKMGLKRRSTWADFARVAARNKRPNPSLLKALAKLPRSIKQNAPALDAGCGTGNDVRAMLKAGLRVEALDSNPTCLHYLKLNLPADKRKSCRPIRQRIEKFRPKLQYALINAVRSLPFIPRSNFTPTFKRLAASIVPGGIFTGIIFGPKDDWAKSPRVVTFTQLGLKRLLRGYKILSLRQSLYRAKPAIGESKQWHEIIFIAQKR